MRRIVGIVIFAIGLLLLLCALLLKVWSVLGLGILGMVVGAAAFGVSFVPRREPAADAPAPLSPADRIIGVFYEPEPVFKNIKHHPRWLAGFLVLAFFGSAYQLALTQRLGVERFAEDDANRRIEAGIIPTDKISPDDYRQAKIREAAAYATQTKLSLPLYTAGFMFIIMLILAGVFLLSVMAFGGKLNYWQALSVAVYGAIPPVVISTILSLVLLYVQSPDNIIPLEAQRHGLARADLGLLFKVTDPITNVHARPVLYTLASSIGLFQLYGWWVTVSGLKNASEKISGGSAWAIAISLWLLGMMLGTVGAVLGPTFVA